MFIAKVKHKNGENGSGHKATMEELNKWIEDTTNMGMWGLPERWLADSPMSPLSEEDKAKAKKKRKVEVMGEKVEEYFFGADYEIIVEDITAEIEAEKAAKEAKKLAKEKRKDERKKLDWNKINTVAELKAIVKSLVEALED